MAQLDPLGIMDADLDSCVPTDIITSSDKLGEELRPLRPPGVPPASGRLALVSGDVFSAFSGFLCASVLCSSRRTFFAPLVHKTWSFCHVLRRV